LPLQRHRLEGPLDPGFHTRHVPPSGFCTLLTVYSLRTSRPQGPVPLMGFTLQSFSLRWSGTPFSALALLSFLTSHSSALRTRRSRCPATPGLCSLPKTVLPRNLGPAKAVTLMGFFVASPKCSPAGRGGGCPSLFPPVLSATDPEGSDTRHSRALPTDQVDEALRLRRTSLRFVHQNPPRPLL
jgi:hypothetical protein